MRAGTAALLRSLLAVACLAMTSVAAQPGWPARPVTLLVAFPAGGSDDLLARLIAPRLGELLGQAVTVENASGKGGVVGALRVLGAQPDGYTLMIGTSATHALSQVLTDPAPYDALSDFTPIGLVATQPFIVIVRRDLPVADLPGLAALSRSPPGALRFTSAGVGSATHLVCELLNARAGIVARHVPREGGVSALKQLLDGSVDYFCPVATIAIPEVRSQTVKAIALLDTSRASALGAVATATEQGFEGATARTWFALFGPARLPATVVQRLQDALDGTLDTPAIRERMEDISARPATPDERTPAQLAAFLRQDIEKWRAALKASGLAQR